MSAAEPSWLSAARAGAEAAFARLGLPEKRDEAWHYTALAPWAERLASADVHAEAAAAAAAQAAMSRAPALDGPRAVFVDGRFSPELSRLEGAAEVTPLSAALGEAEAALGSVALEPAHGVVALNAARFTDGARVRVARRTAPGRPLVLLFASTGGVSHVRSRVEVEAEATAEVVEWHLGGPSSTTTSVTEVVVGPGATLAYARVQDEPDSAVHVGRVEIRHHEGSRFSGVSLIVAGQLQRTEVVAHLAEGAECQLDGFALASADHVADHYTLVVHGSSRGTSRQTYKAIAADRGTSTFYGKVQVAPRTQGNDARQSSKNLLLSPTATANTRPQLEIDAEDVACSHGATVGRLDEQQVYYLRSRGISEAEARALLVSAFAGEVLEHIASAPVRAAIGARVSERIAAVAAAVSGAAGGTTP